MLTGERVGVLIGVEGAQGGRFLKNLRDAGWVLGGEVTQKGREHLVQLECSSP